MAKGIANFVLPTYKDIALGECKVYGNWNLPNQHYIGALKGSSKTTIQRDIKEIKFEGAYGPVKGLRRLNTMTGEVTLSNLGLKYLNEKTISNMEEDNEWVNNDWGGNAGVVASDSSIVNKGLYSSKATIAVGTGASGIHKVFDSSLDLTVFNNSITSDGDDFIGFAIYMTTQDKTDLSTATIRVSLHMDSEGTKTNFYSYDIVAGDITANEWSTFKIAKSSFTENGTGDWSAVTGASIEIVDSSIPSGEVVLYFDNVTLIEDQELSTIVSTKGTGGEFSYVVQGDYRKFTPSLEIADNDYYENIAIITRKFSGELFIDVYEKVYNDGNLSLALEEKDEAVNGTTFTGHYVGTDVTKVPFYFREYDIVT